MKLTQWFTNWVNTKPSAEDIMLRYAQSGKPELLECLVKMKGKDLYHFLVSQTDSVLALDLSQSTWLKVMEKRALYKATGSFKSWLFTLARNLMIDELRQLKRWHNSDNDEQLHISESVSETLAAKDELEQFNALLDLLPFLQKEAFVLQQEGFSINQISDITGDNQETIKSRLRYARNLFKQHLQELR